MRKKVSYLLRNMVCEMSVFSMVIAIVAEAQCTYFILQVHIFFCVSLVDVFPVEFREFQFHDLYVVTDDIDMLSEYVEK